MLPPFPLMTAYMWLEAMMAGHALVLSSVWITQRMKMESGTLLPPWMYEEVWQEQLRLEVQPFFHFCLGKVFESGIQLYKGYKNFSGIFEFIIILKEDVMPQYKTQTV